MLRNSTINKLCGLYDYNLCMENEDGSMIKCITGPNGYGKTTILNMVYYLLIQDWDSLCRIKFDGASFLFDNDEVTISKTIEFGPIDPSADMPIEPDFTFQASLIQDGEMISSFIRRSEKGNTHDRYEGKYPTQITAYLSSIPRFYIREDRKYVSYGNLDASSDVKSMVEEDLTDFRERLASVKGDIKNLIREVELPIDAHYTKQEYEDDCTSLIPQIERFAKYTLYTEGFPSYNQDNPRSTLSVVVALKQVVNKYADFVSCIELFEDLVAKNKFTAKKMIVDSSFGYFFVMDNPQETPLDASLLSSGEQHVIIQYYEMLFKAEKGALVLIDEPEMSYHMAWQIYYMRNLRRIIEKRNLQCIISTHSSQIFERKWEHTCDLYKLTHKMF